ncbi:MAG: NPCBM/NEW2 domain-containing protein [Roseibacillus sp.]
MRRFPLISLSLLLAVGAWLFAERKSIPSAANIKPPLTHSEQAQAKAARATLTQWQSDNPAPSARTLHVVYWTPSDREPAAQFRERLTGIMLHIQDFYRDEMERNGFGPLVFPLPKDEAGLLKIHLVRGKNTFAQYDKKSGRAIREECLPTLRAAGLNPNHETLLIFCNMANWDPQKKTFSHKSPYYAGGSHRGGNAWQLDSPELAIAKIAATEPIITDSEYGKISLGKHNSIFIGGIAHELGHALSLPHNREAPKYRNDGHRALMGEGNRTYSDEDRNEGPGSHLTFASALRLASQPLFSRSQKALQIHAHSDLHDLEVNPSDNSFTFSGRVTTNVPIYGMVAYLDPEGGGDYNAHTVTAVPDAKGNFTLDCQYLIPGRRAELRILSCHVNGATSQKTYSYSVTKEGLPQISSLQTHFALAPLIKALNARDHSQLQESFDHLHTKLGPGPVLNHTNQLAKRLVAGVTDKQQTSIDEIPLDRKTIPLSDIAPAEQNVGYGKPAYDHLPNADLLMISAGKLHSHGIYAHAPALHRYQLDKGWQKLTGTCGLAESRGGSCVFVIKADGREVYRSPVVKTGDSHPFSINLAGVTRLELITDDAGDGKGADWALWLAPLLHR